MSISKIAVFRFEASQKIGAGHAIRSSVLADYLQNLNYVIYIASSEDTYNFIPHLSIYKRIEPEKLIENDFLCDILFIDSYDIDIKLETQYRKHAKKIVVIDDLANRNHDCDVLIDQTYGRKKTDYKNLTPSHSLLLTGIDYILVRNEFLKIKNKVDFKRKETKQINRILITMGGSDPNNYTIKALQEIEKSNFNGFIDIVLGFNSENYNYFLNYEKSISKKIQIHINADMPDLIYKADLSLGASGSGIWERLFLSLPSVLYVTADNQNQIFKNLISNNLAYTPESINHLLTANYLDLIRIPNIIDGLGAKRVVQSILGECL